MENLEETEVYYSPIEFSKKLKLHKNTVLRAIKRGKIQAVNMGTGNRALYRIPASEINRIALFDLQHMVDKMVEEKMKGEN